MVGWFARNSAAVSICSAVSLFCITYGGLGVLWAASVCTYSLILLSVLRAAYAARLTALIASCFTQYRVFLTVLAGMSVMKTTADYFHQSKTLESIQGFSKKNQANSKYLHYLDEVLKGLFGHLVISYVAHETFTLYGFVLHLIDYSVNTTIWVATQLLPVAAPACIAATLVLFSFVKDTSTNILAGAVTVVATLGIYLGVFNTSYALSLMRTIASLNVYTGIICASCTLLASAFLVSPLVSNYYKDDCSKPLSALLIAPLYLLVFSKDNLILFANAIDLVLSPYNGIFALVTLLILSGVIAKIVSDRISNPSGRPVCYHDFNDNTRFGKLQVIFFSTLMYAGIYTITFRKYLPFKLDSSSVTRACQVLTDFFEPYCKSISILSATSFGAVLASDLLKPSVSKNGSKETSLLKQLLFARNTPDNVSTTSSEVTYKL